MVIMATPPPPQTRVKFATRLPKSGKLPGPLAPRWHESQRKIKGGGGETRGSHIITTHGQIRGEKVCAE